MPTVTVREYNPASGALLSNVTTLNFGRVQSGTSSRVKVIDISFGDITVVGNIKLALISNGGITVNANPQDIDAKNTASNGHFGIEDSYDFNAAKTASPLARHFAGVNGTGTASDSNNVLIGSKSSQTSNYIYLDIELGATNINAMNGAYKVFFDFS